MQLSLVIILFFVFKNCANPLLRKIITMNYKTDVYIKPTYSGGGNPI